MPWMIEMISQYGYLAIFALLALGIIGLPVPDELLTLFVGYLSSVMVLNFTITVLVCFIGSITGMLISYTIGLRLGQPVIDKFGKWVGLTPKRFASVKKWFSRFGNWTIFFAYFIPGIRHVTSYISGISAMSFRKFLLVTLASAFTWSLLFVSIGYFAGARLPILK
ncbi:DedA family protein [Paenibacillus ihuae]|uniref:DedA family protein n=1 Tax=Paenibacillus ihuae TaxID=1232431 RepID=UPI0006D57360|nr:DedA family protein [Paenibacillus ihuae]